MLFCLLFVNSFPVERNPFSFLSWCLRSCNLTSPLSRQPAYFFRPLLPYYPVFCKSEGFRSIPIANFLSRGRGYCLFFTSFKNILVRLLRISRSPYVWCWPFRPSFPFRKHSKPYHCWKEGLLLFGCCKGIAFRLSPSLCNSPRGLLFFSFLLASPVAEKHFLCFESIVSTFPALILVLILVVLDLVSPSVLNPSRRKCRSMKKGKSFILFYYTSLWSSFSDNDYLLSVWSPLTCWLTRGEDWVCFLSCFVSRVCVCGWL